jgi:LAO/AO transport system kinase
MGEPLLEAFRRGDRRALARLVTAIAYGDGEAVLGRLGPPSKTSRVVAITGSGGVGKSTLVGKLIEHIRSQGLNVAVLACDPRSPISGGALLGDRFRMPARPDDDGVFIRSLAAGPGQGAVAEHLDAMIRLLERFGFDVVLIETVGAGQGDTAVRELTDMVVLLLQPETGDDLQWEKAGLLEVADLVVIHKADLPGAQTVEGQVRATLGLSSRPAPPVLRVSARSGEGVAELWTAIRSRPLRRRAGVAEARDLLHMVQQELAARFDAALASHDLGLRQILDQWRQGGMDRTGAITALLRLLAGNANAP